MPPLPGSPRAVTAWPRTTLRGRSGVSAECGGASRSWGRGAGVVVVDDFAHHPTEVGTSIEGLDRRYPGRRKVILFEPRSLTAGREFFYDAYLEGLRAGRRGADRSDLPPRSARGARAGSIVSVWLRSSLAPASLKRRSRSVGSTSAPSSWCSPVTSSPPCRRVAFEGMPARLLAALREADLQPEG